MSHHSIAYRGYAGVTTCLRCDRRFQSWDRRQNRLCTTCREFLDKNPSSENSYPPPKRRSQSLDE
jgi:hypothetical protein